MVLTTTAAAVAATTATTDAAADAERLKLSVNSFLTKNAPGKIPGHFFTELLIYILSFTNITSGNFVKITDKPFFKCLSGQ